MQSGVNLAPLGSHGLAGQREQESACWEGSFQGTSVTSVAKADYKGTSETVLVLPQNAQEGFVGSDPAVCPWD